MITVISGTNRKNSKTLVVAKTYYEILKKHTDEEVHFINLEDIAPDLINGNMYVAEGQSENLRSLQNQKIIPADKLFIVSPEYNGSIPGILKLFLDAISIREYVASFKGKKVALAGVSSGRAGNLRGMDQLAHILSHIGVQVMPNKLPLSGIEAITDASGISDEATLEVVEKQILAFIDF